MMTDLRSSHPGSISIFFPAYNDEATIARLVTNALAVLPELTGDFEVIVINDGSTDGTALVLEDLACRFPGHVRVVHHPQNRGYGAALRSGFLHAHKDLVFYTDGDGQYDVREITRLHALLAPDVHIVNGFKMRRADNVSRKIIGGIYNQTARLLFHLPVRDVDCDFRLMRRQCLAGLELQTQSGAICVELVRRLAARKYKFAEIGVSHYPRAHGRSQFFTFKRIARTGIDFTSLWWRLVAAEPFNRSVRKLPFIRAKSPQVGT